MKKWETNFVQKALSRERKKGERGVLSSNDWLKKPSMAHWRILTYLPTYPLVPKLPTWAFFPSQFYSSLSHSLYLSLPILSVLSRGSSSSSVNEGQRGRRKKKELRTEQLRHHVDISARVCIRLSVTAKNWGRLAGSGSQKMLSSTIYVAGIG